MEKEGGETNFQRDPRYSYVWRRITHGMGLYMVEWCGGFE